MTQSAKSTPRDAQVMSTILADMGITEYEPRVINQMLEFSYREYTYCYYIVFSFWKSGTVHRKSIIRL